MFVDPARKGDYRRSMNNEKNFFVWIEGRLVPTFEAIYRDTLVVKGVLLTLRIRALTFDDVLNACSFQCNKTLVCK